MSGAVCLSEMLVKQPIKTAGFTVPCRNFAAAYQQQQRPLHILVNNAGANYLPESYTDAGVGMLCQASCQPRSASSFKQKVVLHKCTICDIKPSLACVDSPLCSSPKHCHCGPTCQLHDSAICHDGNCPIAYMTYMPSCL